MVTMQFDFYQNMSLYTTPLQFGYFFCLLLWVLFLIRGIREERLSDKLLGWVMFILAIELQDYTFGFAGINVLWNELNGFPRNVSLLFGPVIYFYFRSQVNRSFKFTTQHFIHSIPFGVYFLYHLFFFVQGAEVVQNQQNSTIDLVLSYVLEIVLWTSYAYYFYQCLRIYKAYRVWSIDQYSNEELINFKWFRNFIYTMMFWLICQAVMSLLDAYFSLDFYQDWWWNLALVGVALYIGFTGYTQVQPIKIYFELSENIKKSIAVDTSNVLISDKDEPDIKRTLDAEETKTAVIAKKLNHLMMEDRLYLQPDLNLQELAQHIQINTVQLSATINKEFGKNFNDYINTYRVEEFIRLFKNDQNKQYTILSIAYDSGFNSKATFNRAFKKIKGVSPKVFFENKQE